MEVTAFAYGGDLTSNIDIVIGSTKYKNQGQEQEENQQEGEEKNKIDLNQVADDNIKILESKGVENIIVKQEQFITPNGAAGLKTYGTAKFPIADKLENGNYVLLGFTSENVLLTLTITWKDKDVYADQIVERILNSIELIKLEEEDK